MPDYLTDVGDGLRRASFIACLAAAPLCTLISMLLGIDMISPGSILFNGKPIWIAELLMTWMAITSTIIAWRLRPGAPRLNGVTLIPLWVIQGWGLSILSSTIFLAFDVQSPAIYLAGVAAALPLIFVARFVEHRLSQLRRDNRNITKTD